MKDSELFELINFHPDDAGWIQQMYRRELGGQYGHRPASSWCQWAGEFLLAASTDREGVDVLLRLLALAETLYPGGMERTRLEESLGYLFEMLPSRLGRYPTVTLSSALQQRLIREDQVDLWAPGMASGKGWRTYCRLTLTGKSKVDLSEMPSKDSTSPERAVPIRQPVPWRPPVQEKPKVDQPPKTTTLPEDFVWQKPYVNQQVSYFFKRHAKLYSAMVLDVLNAKVEMNQFASEFGPAKISRWINEKHHVKSDHPNPCKPQNINSSATYVACVKSFKLNPDNHQIAKLLCQAESKEVEAILQELLGGEDSPA